MRRPVDRYVSRLLDDRRPHAFTASLDDVGRIRVAIELIDCRVGSGRPSGAFCRRLRWTLSMV
jgi:hypothetical protein